MIIFATTQLQKPPTITQEELDINANHLVLVEIDHYGKPIAKLTIPLNTQSDMG